MGDRPGVPFVDEKDSRIANIILNRPEAMNALSADLWKEFLEAVDIVDEEEDVHVVVVKARGRAFSAGYDIAPGGGSSGYTQPTVGQIRHSMTRWTEGYVRLWKLRKVTIAQVHGYCLSGATELSGMCDLIIASEDAQFGHIAGRHGGTLRTNSLWPYTIGMRRTKELLFTGDFIDARTALSWGMINRVAPPEKLEEEVFDMARRVMRIHPELLDLHKAETNRFFEIMGLQAAVFVSADLDAMGAFIKNPVRIFNYE